MALPEHAFHCFEAINAELSRSKVPPPPFEDSGEFPLFVTWNIKSRNGGAPRLRGCIGNFEALPLGEGLADYAKISAFQDHRFDPISAKELPRLECGVSLLMDFETCDDYLDWELGTHGIYVEFVNPALNLLPTNGYSTHLPPGTQPPQTAYRSLSHLPKLEVHVPRSQNPRNLKVVLHATFLPEVAPAQGWGKVDAVDAAMRKAGFKGAVTVEMRRAARVSRYQSKKVKVSYEEWQAWRKEQGQIHAPQAMAAQKTGTRLGYIAPDFEAQTTQGKIRFHEFIDGKWTILFSHPADFTPVCTTELAEAARLAPEFQKRGVQMIGLSCNELGSHSKWIKDINKFGSVDLQFPIIADPTRDVAKLYDMLDEQDLTNLDEKGVPFTVRTVFIIDPKKTIRLSLQYPASTGRQFNEILRCIDSLQLGDKNKITTPANWQPGEKVIVHPSVKTEDARKIFPNEVQEIYPYLRFTQL
ncbi:AMMECR1 domain containing protein [Rhodotorula toruloides]|uniref:AMMECR1 domain containing protein n=1 Tax=Rhodotorula toruloides TaxID=5286 RepID=A0A511KHF8_RHOTO|nr:AMMECR1 domain containing protein [Rhodotorula toruloides]